MMHAGGNVSMKCLMLTLDARAHTQGELRLEHVPCVIMFVALKR